DYYCQSHDTSLSACLF
nr:immunoglobulin light chain junction region [Macaca mulatta]